MPAEPTPQRNPDPEPPSDGGTSYTTETAPPGYQYVPPSERDPVSQGVAAVQEFGGWFDAVKYYANLYAVFWLATVVLIIGILLIFGKQIFGVVAGGKIGAAAELAKAVTK